MRDGMVAIYLQPQDVNNAIAFLAWAVIGRQIWAA